MDWIIFYVLPLVLTYVVPFYMARNRSKEGTTIGDLCSSFYYFVEQSMPFSVFVIVTVVPVLNLLPFIIVMIVCLYFKLKDIVVK